MSTKRNEGLFQDLPRWAKMTLALSAIVIFGGVWVGVPLLSALGFIGAGSRQDGDSADYIPMMAVLVTMTTLTITGIFLFMTLRIDRGTRMEAKLEAERVARDVGRSEVEEVRDDAQKKLREMSGKLNLMLATVEEKVDAAVTRTDKSRLNYGKEVKGAIDELVRQAVPEDVLQRHLKEALLIETNGQVINTYVRQRVQELDAHSIESLVNALKEAAVVLSQGAEREREEVAQEPGVVGRLLNWRPRKK